MSLYALTVKQPSATQDAISGDFLGNGKQQILTANGSRLALLEVSRRQKGFQELASQDVFGIVRRIAKFRVAGGSKGTSSSASFPATSQLSDSRSSTQPPAPGACAVLCCAVLSCAVLSCAMLC